MYGGAFMSIKSSLKGLPGLDRAAHRAHVAAGYRDARRTIAEAGSGPARCAPSAYRSLVHQLASDCDSVIDVGTGDMAPLAPSPCRNRGGAVVHRPYLEHRAVSGPVPVHADARRLSELFVACAADLVQAMDVLEHLEPEDAGRMLEEAETVAGRRVLIATPRGFFEQGEDDIFEMGLGGEELQAHRSGWEVEDFTKRGYRVAIIEGFHGAGNAAFVRAYGADAKPIDGLVAWKDKS